ncbi:MAG: hypothetical protein ACLVHV_14935 [Oscillospiraceae bacterium]
MSSGIDTGNYEKARDEILRQLEACRAGEITQAELRAAQEAICSSLRTIADAAGRMEDFALFRLLSRFPLDRAGLPGSRLSWPSPPDQVAKIAAQVWSWTPSFS